jgi:hypothetical protein
MRFALATLVLLSTWAHAQSGNERAARIAATNVRAKRAKQDIDAQAQQLKNPAIKKAVLELLAAPKPSFMDRFATPEARERVRAQLVDAKLLDAAVKTSDLFPPLPAMPFSVAPASPVGHHHGWPGGLAEHTAFNLKSALALEAQYRAAAGVEALDHDLVIAAPILHDLFKTWVLQWQADGTTLAQPALGGTASHHVFAVAEVLYRKLPPTLALAVANAHEPSGPPVQAYLKAAALLAGVEAPDFAWPVLPEGAINHLSDHDYVLADPAEGPARAAIARWLKGTPDAWAIHEIEAQVSGLAVYAAWVKGGDDAVTALLKAARPPRAP